MKSKTIAILICLIFAVIGGHRFYLGYTLIGVLQFLTLGGCFIWTLVDLIRLIRGTLLDYDWNELV